MAKLEKEIRDSEIEENQIVLREQYEKNIFEQQLEFFQNMKLESQELIQELQEQFDSDNINIDRYKILKEIESLKLKIKVSEKNIIRCNYDLYLLRKEKDKDEPFRLTPYY